MAFLIKNYTGGAFTTPASDYYQHFGGIIKVDIYGALGTGQIKFEASPDGGTTWITQDFTDTGLPAIFTAPKTTIIETIPTNDLLRAVYSGGTATNLNVKVNRER